MPAVSRVPTGRRSRPFPKFRALRNRQQSRTTRGARDAGEDATRATQSTTQGRQRARRLSSPWPKGAARPRRPALRTGGFQTDFAECQTLPVAEIPASGSGFDGYPRASPRLYTSSQVKITTAETIMAAVPSLRLPSR